MVLNLHHLPESVCGVIGDGTHLGLSVKYSWESPLLGSAGGPRHALPLLDADEFLIVNGDTLCPAPLEPILSAHRATGADVTMAVVPNPDRAHYNGIVAAGDGRVTSFIPRGHTADSWHFVGIQVVKASVFASLPDNVAVGNRVRHLPGARAAWRRPRVCVPGERAVLRHRHASRLHDCGARPGPARRIRLPRRRGFLADAGSTDTLIWPGSVVGPGATLDGCVVAGAHVPAGFQASGAMLLPAGVIRAGDRAAVTDGVAVFPLN